ncbi:hypothetical protein LCGC14_1539220 [marine sediment metagenome]|uniref:Transcriptional coactivator p15 (PC4) C-terminal domain-containing protein n=1 Tax=marine sediment metagenome TaxID=412755 RepID=A0A0F9ITP6_9ZZZZ
MSRPTEQSEVVAEFERADGVTLLRVGIGKNGEPYVDLRNYWQPTDADDWAPTKKGVRLHGEQLSKLIEALQQAKSKLDKLYA